MTPAGSIAQLRMLCTAPTDTIQRVAALLWTAAQPATVVAGLCAYVVYKVVYAQYISPVRNIPGPFYARLSALPSRIRGLLCSTNDEMISMAKQHGPVFLMEPRKVAVCHPDDCRMILNSYAFVKDTLYSNVDFMEPNIFLTRNVELNKQRRRQIGPALSMPGLRKMEPTILAAGPQQLMAQWDKRIGTSGDGRVRICYFYDLTLMSFDIIASLGFGQQHRSLTTGDQTIAHWVEKTFALMILQMVLPVVKMWPLRPLANFVLGKHVDEFFAFAHQAVRQRKLEVAKGLVRTPDILQQFIEAEDPHNHGIRMTSQQVITETIMMLLSGADTSSTALAWTLHLLLLYPEHYQRAVTEVRSAFSRDHTIGFDEAQQHAPFLEACVLEALRVCPVSTNLPRIVPRGGVNVQGHHIPEGYSVAISTAAANYDPSTWVDPHRFDPHRFDFVNNPCADTNRRNLMTLSAGVRVCPGRHLVTFEMVVTLANILNRYDLSLPDDALYTPANVDEHGLPRIMPRTNLVAMVPKYPLRDCNVIVSRRP
ncbi:hypothetical protein GGF43_001129 [Coemansia sp. RSA 2618]|nr:hypothetical protein GGF43_001129 [Coemansia sp. RSA 2618]